MSLIGVADMIDQLGIITAGDSIAAARLERVRRAEESYRKAMSAAADARGLSAELQATAYNNECAAAAPLVMALYGLIFALAANYAGESQAEESEGA